MRDDQLEILRVTNLLKVIPTYETASDAIWEFGEFNEWDRTRVESVRKFNADQKASASRAGDYSLVKDQRVIIGASLAVVVVLAFVGWQLKQTFTAKKPKLLQDGESFGIPFDAVMQGHLHYERNNVDLDDVDATIIAWPVDSSALENLSKSEMMKRVGRQTPDYPRVTKTTAKGEYRLPVRGKNTKVQLHLLMVSKAQKRDGDIPSHDLTLLKSVSKDPDGLLGDRAYTLTRVIIEPDGVVETDWKF